MICSCHWSFQSCGMAHQSCLDQQITWLHWRHDFVYLTILMLLMGNMLQKWCEMDFIERLGQIQDKSLCTMQRKIRYNRIFLEMRIMSYFEGLDCFSSLNLFCSLNTNSYRAHGWPDHMSIFSEPIKTTIVGLIPWLGYQDVHLQRLHACPHDCSLAL